MNRFISLIIATAIVPLPAAAASDAMMMAQAQSGATANPGTPVPAPGQPTQMGAAPVQDADTKPQVRDESVTQGAGGQKPAGSQPGATTDSAAESPAVGAQADGQPMHTDGQGTGDKSTSQPGQAQTASAAPPPPHRAASPPVDPLTMPPSTTLRTPEPSERN